MIESTRSVSRQGLLAVVDALAQVDPFASDAERVDQLAALERVKEACAAAQAAVTAAFVASQEQVPAERRRGRGSEDGAERSDVAAGLGGSMMRRGHLGRGIAGQVALDRRESPARGSQHVKLALALVHEMPNTFAALNSGLLSEARAETIVRECAHLSGEQRRALDAELVVITRPDASDTDEPAAGDGLGSLGDRELTRRVRALAYRADPGAAAERCAKAALERRVELRHAADAMCRLTAHLPLAQALAAHAALTASADTARAGGDPRRKGQLMADTLVERVTGQERADVVPIEMQLVITPDSLFDVGDTPAQVPGYGTVPAAWARDFLTHDTDPHHDQPVAIASARPGSHSSDPPGDADAEMLDAYGGPATGEDEFGGFLNSGSDTWPLPRPFPVPPPTGRTATKRRSRDGAGDDGAGDAGAGHAAWGNEKITERARVWLRRMYAHPKTGQLVAMDSTRRAVDGNLRRFLIARDAATCRTLWCDAPIRHLDHIRDFADGGPTSAANGQGLCARCNHTKNLPDWQARALTAQDSTQHTTLPTVLTTILTTTPTGHTYRSHPPPLVPTARTSAALAVEAAAPLSAFERHLAERIAG
ncbi:MAG: HNH endonuclease [Terracoccus sp.]